MNRRRPQSRAPRQGGPRDRRAARELGGEQVEGRQAVRELLLAGSRRVHEVVTLQDTDDGGIGALAAELRVPVRRVGRGKLEALAKTESPQGVVARAAPLAEVDIEDLVEGGHGRAPFLLAVDGVTDPGNLGALLRSAEGLGVTGVVLPRHRAVHITPTVAKAAAGAIEHLPMAVVGGLPSALRALSDRGVWIVGLDMSGEPIDRLTIVDEPIALVVGAEGRGLSRLVRQRCDAIAAVPMHGRLGSLNVAAAGAIACWEVARRRGSGH